ncbi:MAG: rRNA maturation endonuclease Nob1 [Lentimonas sp.]|jgi:rRNA maturation endonuclease Nob1
MNLRNDPFWSSRMAGGMVKDALDEADVNLSGKAETVIMIKCRDCGQLNEEDSKFCQECGVEM